jgi:hypothetical protein
MRLWVNVMAFLFSHFFAAIANADLRCLITDICYPGVECSKVKYVMVISESGDGIVARMVDGSESRSEFREVSEDGTRWFGRLDGQLEDARIVAIRENGFLNSARYVLNDQVGTFYVVQNVASCTQIESANSFYDVQKKNYDAYSESVCPVIVPNPRTEVRNKQTGQTELAPFKVNCFCHYNAMVAELSDQDITSLLTMIGKDIDDIPGIGDDFIGKVRSASNNADRNCIQEMTE